tara:strand:- start:20 stop:244 length:225 start_codon:yes stop_codon:yes gene_type:complete
MGLWFSTWMTRCAALTAERGQRQCTADFWQQYRVKTLRLCSIWKHLRLLWEVACAFGVKVEIDPVKMAERGQPI